MLHDADEVIRFWFAELSSADWFRGSAELDARITQRFASLHASVGAGEAFRWRVSAEGRLAEIVVLDQFSRQMFRGSARAFASDGMALVLAQEAIDRGADQQVDKTRRMFMYMPYMHSESLLVHEEALRLFTALADETVLKFAHEHNDVIRRFGRYPRRNAALGRESTPDEITYMSSGGRF